MTHHPLLPLALQTPTSPTCISTAPPCGWVRIDRGGVQGWQHTVQPRASSGETGARAPTSALPALLQASATNLAPSMACTAAATTSPTPCIRCVNVNAACSAAPAAPWARCEQRPTGPRSPPNRRLATCPPRPPPPPTVWSTTWTCRTTTARVRLPGGPGSPCCAAHGLLPPCPPLAHSTPCRAGMSWYHPHWHGSATHQVFTANGLYIVEGA